MIRPDERGGTTQDAATGADVRLTPEQRRELAAAGRSIAAHFGAPQDIEWAFAGGRLWVLQARPLTALPPAPRRVNPVRRMMGSIVAELLPVRPYPLDMSTWTVRGHGRILTRMLAEIPGLKLDLRRMLPETEGVVDELVPPEPHPTVRTLTAPVRAIRQARRFDTRNWTRDPRFALFEREVTELRSLDPRALGWPELVGIPDRVLVVPRRPDQSAGRLPAPRRAEPAKLRLRLGRARSARARPARCREGSAPARLTRTPASPRSPGSWRRRPEWLAAFRESDPAGFAALGRADEQLAELRANPSPPTSRSMGTARCAARS